MTELLYDTDSALIAGVLFVSMAVAIEIGLRVVDLHAGMRADAAR